MNHIDRYLEISPFRICRYQISMPPIVKNYKFCSISIYIDVFLKFEKNVLSICKFSYFFNFTKLDFELI